MLERKKGLVDLSCCPFGTNKWTGKVKIEEVYIKEDISAKEAEQVHEINLQFSRVISVLPPDHLRLFANVKSLNLTWTGLSDLPDWASEFRGLNWVTFNPGRTVRVGKPLSGGLVRRSTDVWDFVVTKDQIEDMIENNRSPRLTLEGRMDCRWTEGHSINTLIIDSDVDEVEASKVKEMGMMSSKIKTVQPPEKLRAFKNVKVLELTGTGLADVPSWSKELTGLAMMRLDDGNWRFVLNKDNLHEMRKETPTTLDLSAERRNSWTRGNSIQSLIIEDSVKADDVAHLKEIRLNESKIEVIEPVEKLKLFANVEMVNLEGSGVKNIPHWIELLPRLKWLKLKAKHWHFVISKHNLEESLRKEAGKLNLQELVKSSKWTNCKGKFIVWVMSEVGEKEAGKVEKFDFAECHVIDFLPESSSRIFVNMKMIDLTGSRFRAKPDWLARFPALDFYSLDNGEWCFVTPNG